jgi:uroporphyrinogen-III decarboxylase
MMTLTSRQRLLNAISHQEVDHVPLLLRFWSLNAEVDHIPFDWRDEVTRVESTLALGLDDTLLLQPPLGYVEEYVVEHAPGVQSQVERIMPGPGEPYPRLKKTYPTPGGPLQTVVKVTEDWPRGDDIHLFDDYNLSRLAEPLIKERADIRRLKHLLADPSPEQVAEFRQRAATLRQSALRLGVVLDGGWVALGDAAMWLCGMERILYGQMDEPAFIEELLDAILEWEMKRIDYLIPEGIEVLVQMAWYETTDFWTPANWRRLLKPRLQQIIDKVHSHGIKYRYIITKSWKPYWVDFLEMGVDCLTGVDPVQDRLDLAQVKSELGGQICLMGGLNSALMFSQWSDGQIRQATDQALQIMAPGGGFILFPVDAVFDSQPWEKVQTLIDHWKARCDIK